MAIFNALYRTTCTLKPHYPVLRCMCKVPESQTPNQRVTLTHLKEKHSKRHPITVVTAYDYSSAVHLDRAGIDVCLVGDSASMVVHGRRTTLDEMLVHCRAVARGTKRPLLVGDLPVGSYESSTEKAVETAMRVLNEGEMDAIQLGGLSTSGITAAEAIVRAGIAVMGHVGLTPDDISVLGEFKPQADKSDKAVMVALKVVKSAKALENAGCFAVVLECVPPPVAAAVTDALGIPTIGIGAGPFCSGQGLLYHDLLGMVQHPHHPKVAPEFCKQYASVGVDIYKALSEYKREVTNDSFPDSNHSPYKISESVFNCFFKELDSQAASKVSDRIDEVKSPWWWSCSKSA